MLGKLREQVGYGGVVRVEVQTEDDRIVQVERTFDGDDDPIVIRDADTGETIEAHVAQLFPILAYSQTEALEIAKDHKAQLHLIDTLIDVAPLQNRIDELGDELAEADKELVAALIAADVRNEKETDVKTLRERIAQIDRALKSEKHDELRKLEPKSRCLAEMVEEIDGVSSCLEEAAETLSETQLPVLEGSLKEDADLKQLHRAIEKLRAKALADVATLRKDVASLESKVRTAEAAWKKHVREREAEYKKWAEAQGGDKPKLTAERKQLQNDLAKAEKTLKAVRAKANGLSDVTKSRNELLKQLRGLRDELYERRAARYSEIQRASSGRLELSILRGGDRDSYIGELLALKKGSNLQESTVRAVAAKVDPEELVALVLADNYGAVAKQVGITDKQAEKLVQYLRGLEAFEEVLALEHAPLCVDKPSIRYRKDDGKHYGLESVSVGQKCTALLIIALSDGDRPVIIDQPEDALDSPSIFTDVTTQLRDRKGGRQFVVTTHNSTVAVAGDTDNFQVLTATASNVTLAASGAIDRPTITLQVIQHLEGGKEPFELKGRKYAGRR